MRQIIACMVRDSALCIGSAAGMARPLRGVARMSLFLSFSHEQVAAVFALCVTVALVTGASMIGARVVATVRFNRRIARRVESSLQRSAI